MLFQNKKINWFAFIIIVVSVSIVGIFSISRKSKQQHVNWEESLLSKLKPDIDNFKFDSSIRLSLEDENLYLKDVIKPNELKLIIHFSELNCNVCVDSIMNWINEDINLIGYQNVIFISRYFNKRSLFLYKRINRIEREIYNCLDFCAPLDNLNLPYMFILDGDFTIKYLKFPDKSNRSTFKEYLQEVSILFER